MNTLANQKKAYAAKQGGKSFAGKQVLAVSRSTRDYYVITSGTATNDKVRHDTSFDVLIFDVNNPFVEGETVWVMWKNAD